MIDRSDVLELVDLLASVDDETDVAAPVPVHALAERLAGDERDRARVLLARLQSTVGVRALVGLRRCRRC